MPQHTPIHTAHPQWKCVNCSVACFVCCCSFYLNLFSPFSQPKRDQPFFLFPIWRTVRAPRVNVTLCNGTGNDVALQWHCALFMQQSKQRLSLKPATGTSRSSSPVHCYLVSFHGGGGTSIVPSFCRAVHKEVSQTVSQIVSQMITAVWPALCAYF